MKTRYKFATIAAITLMGIAACSGEGGGDAGVLDAQANDAAMDAMSDAGSNDVFASSDVLSDAPLPDVLSDSALDSPTPRRDAGAPPSNLPPELDSLRVSLIFEDNFDDQRDLANPVALLQCSGPVTSGCDLLPDGWTDFAVSERFHPMEFDDPTLEPNLQINDRHPRGGSGKSLLLHDESFGNSGQWGSDVMLARSLDPGHRDIYVEMWVLFQPDYRWHLVEDGHGQNLAKVLRIGHREVGAYGLSYGPNGPNGPMVFVDTMVWASNGRGDRAALSVGPRCDPQATNYFCEDFDERVLGFVPGQPSFAESMGDGNWHKIAARMRLNSSPGVADGKIFVWFDDELVASNESLPWLGAGSSADNLLNSVIVGGNMHNYPEPEENRFEQWYAVDDVRIFAIDE